MASVTILYAVLTIGLIGLVMAVVLHFVSKFFRVEEDVRIDRIMEYLPNANCGGCGFAGCRALAEAVVNNNSLDGCFCPGGDMEAIACVMGLSPAAEVEKKVAVLRCNGSRARVPARVQYDSAPACAFAGTLFAGANACAYACLGCGDCAEACPFGCISIDPEERLPVIDAGRCLGCGVCVKACPRGVLELRSRGRGGRRVYVACNNKDKGATARKNCQTACIGCGKCAKVCPFGAVTVNDNLAYIDFNKCKACGKCVEACPTGAIRAVNFPVKKEPAADLQPAVTAES